MTDLHLLPMPRVVAVRYGELLTTREKSFLNYADWDEADGPQTLAYYFWVIWTAGRTVIVDTGFDTRVGTRRGRRVLIDPLTAFNALGIGPTDPVDIVVSHAHYDHIGNLGYFTNATVHISRAEFEFWLSEASQQHLMQELVERDELKTLEGVAEEGRLRFVSEGDLIAPAVQILEAPGHTPGQLMVLVGDTLLTADAVHFDEEVRRRMPFRHMTDVAASDDVYRRIRRLETDGHINRIITGHDPSTFRDNPAIDGPLAEHAVVIADGTPASPSRKVQHYDR